jgi:hypothetical protein
MCARSCTLATKDPGSHFTKCEDESDQHVVLLESVEVDRKRFAGWLCSSLRVRCILGPLRYSLIALSGMYVSVEIQAPAIK